MKGMYMLGREADNELSVRGKRVLIKDLTYLFTDSFIFYVYTLNSQLVLLYLFFSSSMAALHV
jgi:hypothetical protein